MANYTIVALTALGPALSNTGGRHLAMESGGRLWASYSRKPSGAARFQIHCAYSDDEGKNWTETQVTDIAGADTDAAFYPVIAIDSSDDMHLAFTSSGRGAFPAKRSLLYTKRTSGVWGSEEEIALKDVNDPGQNQPSLAIDSADDVHVVWEGTGWGANPTKFSIQYRKRSSGSWDAVEEIANATEDQRGPHLAMDASDNVHVVWFGKTWGVNTTFHNMQYRKRTSSWQSQEAITDTGSDQVRPSVALDSDDNVHVVWWSGTDVFYRKRTTSWQTQEDVALGSSSDYVTIAVDKNDAILVVYATGSAGIQYKQRVSSWSDALVVKAQGVGGNEGCSLLWAKHPTVSSIRTNVPNKAYVVWEESGSEVLFGLPFLVFPSDPSSRVTEIIHRFTSRNVKHRLTMEVGLGGATQSSLTVLSLTPPTPPELTPEPDSALPGALFDYLKGLFEETVEEKKLLEPDITPPTAAQTEVLGPFSRKVEGGTQIYWIGPEGEIPGAFLPTGFPL